MFSNNICYLIQFYFASFFYIYSVIFENYSELVDSIRLNFRSVLYTFKNIIFLCTSSEHPFRMLTHD